MRESITGPPPKIHGARDILIGSVCDNKVSVSVVTPEPGGRGIPRVELAVYGARYPYKLSPADARTLAESLTVAVDSLSTPTATQAS